ncbi:MAG: hypothetical protein EXS13_13420 [Planctomycetes bacterium]|nr:hypothetical protein [Planctomycetota bacterium]
MSGATCGSTLGNDRSLTFATIGTVLLGGGLAGFALGALECALLVRAMEAAVATPVADSVQVACCYALTAAVLALLALLALRRMPFAIALAAAVVAFVIAGDWVHERALTNVGFFAPASLLATAGLAIGALLLGALFVWSAANRPRATWLGGVLVVAGALGSITMSTLGASGGTAAAGDASVPTAADGQSRPHVIVVLIDTLRADRLGCYGYDRPTSPELDALAARGVVFENAYAQAPMTRGSVASLFTSLDPDAHATNDVLERLPDSADTLAEKLQRAGWRTACFSTNENVSPVFGFDQGFDAFWLHRLSRLSRFTAWGRLSRWVTETLGIGRRSADLDDSDARHLTDAVLGWLPGEALAPQFLWVQYIDPHSPYAPPDDLINTPSPDPERMATHARFTHNCPPHPFGRWPEQEAGIVDGISQLYDAEIRFCDREVGRLVRELDTRGFLRSSWLVITADHGEEFFDHQQLGHGQSMYDELLRVPLIVLGPGVAPGRVATPVQLIDLLPTLVSVTRAEELAVAAAATRNATESSRSDDGVSESSGSSSGSRPEPRGRDLAELLLADPAARAELAPGIVAPFVFAQRSIDPPQAMVRVGTEKLIVIEQGDEHCTRLFDLSTDPREQRDLALQRPDRVTALLALLERRRAAARATRLEGGADVELSEDAKSVLRALGYVGDDK